MAKISVTLPIYIANDHLAQLTRECLYSLEGKYDELVIVDDASPLPTGEFRDKADVFKRNVRNRGYIQSANRAIRHATCDHIIAITSDTRLLSGSLYALCMDGYVFPTVEGKAMPFWDGAFYAFPTVLGGLYDTRYKNYFGDLDKFYEAKMRGMLLAQVSDVVVFHHQSQSTQTKGIRTSDYEYGKEQFMKKWNIDPLADYYNLL